MAAYYNEIEPYAAEWLRNLIKAGHIADGEVDTRSIVDVQPFDLQGFDQCHFFAGIGGWSHALRLAGWPDDRPVWTGSCPCQPFSVAGKGGGVNDERHLWPHFYRLIRACRPNVVVGEQVAGKAGYGWFDGVRADLETDHYACRAVDIPALAVNAPHIRQRLYWTACSVADGDDGGRQWGSRDGDGERDGQAGERHEDHGLFAGCGEDRRYVADTEISGWGQGVENAGRVREGDSLQGSSGRPSQHGDAQPVHMADANNCGSFTQSNRNNRKVDGTVSGKESAGHQSTICFTPRSSDNSFWSDHIWLTGSDGKSRRAKPGLPLLAHGVSNRVGRLRAYGNAIVPPLAAEVIKALM